MRLPVNSPYTKGAGFGATGKAYLGDSRVHNGQDLSSTDRKIIAPESGTASAGYDSKNGHYSIVINGNFRHFLGHQAKAPISGRVSEGQHIGTMGTTGLSTGIHTHWSIRKMTNGKQGVIEDPMKYLTKGDDMANRTQVNDLYKAILHRQGDVGGLNTYTGQDASKIVSAMLGSSEFKNHQAFVTNASKQIKALQVALTNEQNKPAKVVTKEVDKIVDRIVKVEIPVEVIKTVETPTTWTSVVEFFRNVINKFLRKDT